MQKITNPTSLSIDKDMHRLQYLHHSFESFNTRAFRQPTTPQVSSTSQRHFPLPSAKVPYPRPLPHVKDHRIAPQLPPITNKPLPTSVGYGLASSSKDLPVVRSKPRPSTTSVEHRPVSTPQHLPVIKSEPRSPSPPPRRSATSGSKRFFPVPQDCTRLNPNYVANRRNWAQRECVGLRELGLHITKYFFRDDGMVIEWTSKEEVWLDTLLHVKGKAPVKEPEIIDVDAESDSEPPDMRSRSANAISPTPTPIHSLVLSPEHSTVEDEEEPMSFEEEETHLHQCALNFLQKFITTFDADRASLVTAYSDDATLSFRDNNFAHPQHFTVRRSSAANSKPSLPKIPVLDGFRFVHPGGWVNVDYDVLVLDPPNLPAGKSPTTDVMLSIHGEVVDADQRALAIDQAFVLRKCKGAHQWPLIVLSHEMVVRDTPWVQWTGKPEDLEYS
ncbi:NTF2 domain-containing protein [Mycena indigotica]|uniref:NTF2 domain-containing protein n=1 Tax=Mycena indigotica TaxID=2126181 RepID=A0A8H6S275_9AGAR|nr:NTF2 domain-containing protein [Mycena indigotica]KAF7289960.1 NTF2 domain-containing protein [Mycena indigotica]